MSAKQKWVINDDEKNTLIDNLCDELPSLRAKAGIPQEELSKFIGVSRQTYGAIERKTRKMSWDTYLSLIMIFDADRKTRDYLRCSSAFPTELIRRFNDGEEPVKLNLSHVSDISNKKLKETLDEKAMHTISTVIMAEYSRCADIKPNAAIRSFRNQTFDIDLETDTNKDK